MAASALTALKPLDPERYLACLLMPDSVREAVAALFLFNAELAVVRDRVKEPMAGEMRLAWWREVISGERESEAAAHPAAHALLQAIVTHGLPRDPLLALSEARSFDLYDDPMPDRSAFEGYAGETAAALIQMTALLIGPEDAGTISDAAGHAGVAHAVAGHLQLLPVTRARGQIYVPGDLLAACGLDRDTFLDPERNDEAERAVAAFADYGETHLATVRRLWASVPPILKPAFLPLANTPLVLSRARKSPAAALAGTIAPGPLRRQWSLFHMARSARIPG